jgi:hypothetical protein
MHIHLLTVVIVECMFMMMFCQGNEKHDAPLALEYWQGSSMV